MKGRDLAIVAAVVLVGGFALADSLRSRADEPAQTATTVRDDTDGPEPQPDAPEDWPAGRLRGTLLFTDAQDCRVRVIGLGGGRERPSGELVGFCRLWAAPIGQRIAYGTSGVRGTAGEGVAVVDLRRAGVELASIQNLSPGGDVLWSPDAQRVAWCTPNGVGQELELGAERPRSFARCPVAYTPEGNLAFAVGRKLVSNRRTWVTVPERLEIRQAFWGADGSLLVVLAEGIIRRYEDGGLTDAVALPTDSMLTPSPDNCAVSFVDAGLIRVEDVGCFRAPPRAFIGLDSAWSPDGFWLAVADPDEIKFHRVLGGEETIVWPARARELYWRDS